MEWDDIIYMSLLLFCIGFGHFYRSIRDVEQKKWIGSGVGLLIILIVSGFHILHTIFSFLVCSIIILFVNKRQCHLVCFVFMFSYLFFFRKTILFGIPTPPGHTNLIQMILTLKLVGLAFETNTAYTKQKSLDGVKKTDGHTAEVKSQHIPPVPLTVTEKEILNLKIIDIFHYAFNYVGVLTGPYFSYKTFRDYFTLPYSDYADCKKATIDKIKWVPLFGGLFLLASYLWPLNYATSAEFYETRSFFYRLMYVWPTFFIFRMRIYAGLTLSECVCTMAGFGAYPIEYASTAGGGPKDPTIKLSKSPDKLKYDFETIHNIDAYTTDTCWTFREALRSWNMCVQYWLAINIYKRFPNKKFRTGVTLLVSAFWHGVYSGYYVCMLGAPCYLPIEDLYHKLFRKNAVGLKRKIIDVIFWISKFFAFSYMGIAFLLMTLDKIWYYYNSVYHCGYFLWIAMYVVGVFLLKRQKAVEKAKERSKKDGLKKIE